MTMRPFPRCAPRRGISAAAVLACTFALGASANAGPAGGLYDRAIKDRLYLRGGFLYLRPMPDSDEVALTGLQGAAELALPNGPIPGSGVGAEPATILAGAIGYRVTPRISLEAVLAVPFVMDLTFTGTLATDSVAPYALGNIPTGVPAFGATLGTTKVTPPIVTAVYRHPLSPRLRPYAGLGLAYVMADDTHITNSVLTELTTPEVEIESDLAWVLQGGVDVQLWRRLYLTLDAKYVGGLDLVAEMRGLELAVPELPLYGTVSAGTGTAEVAVNPLVFQAGVGWDF